MPWTIPAAELRLRVDLASAAADATAERPAPVTDTQLVASRRPQDTPSDLWTVLNRVQENVARGGLPGRSAQGRRMTTRAVQSIDASVQLNRALWVLAEEMRRLAA